MNARDSSLGPAAEFERRMVDTFGMTHDDFEDERAEGPVSMAYLQNAIELINRSGVNDKIVQWDAERRKSNAGVKRIIPLSAVLPIMLLHIQMGRGVVYWDIASTLHSRFKLKHFELLGIANVHSAKEDWYHRFWQSLKQVLKLIDPYPLPLDGKMEAGEYAERLQHITQGDGKADHQRKLDRINWLCNELVLTSVRTTPAEFLRHYRGNISIDASLVPILGTPNPAAESEEDRRNPDPFSGRYRREGNHDGKGAKTDLPGYEVETATMAWNRPQESSLFPSLITAISFHRPGQLIGHGMALISRHKSAFALDRFLVMADRAYNGSKVSTFHIPARLAGVELVIDYKYIDRGVQGHYRDLILVDGNWYVDSMPENLVEATWDLHKLESEVGSSDENFADERAKLLARIKNRELYRMTPKGLPDGEGYQRFTYPKNTPVPHEPLDGATSITIPMLVPEVELPPREPGGDKRKLQPIKHLQRFPYMSKDWYAHYGMRNLVESSNSRFKDSSHEALGNPGKRSGRGFAFQYLATALSVVSSNLRAIASFMLKLRNSAIETPVRTRRRKGPDGWPLARPVAVASLAPPG